MKQLVIKVAELARRLSVPEADLRVEVFQEGTKAGDAVRVDLFLRGRHLTGAEARIAQAYLVELGLNVSPAGLS